MGIVSLTIAALAPTINSITHNDWWWCFNFDRIPIY